MINYLKCTKRLFVALTTTTALASSLTLASCQDYDAIDENQLQEVLAQKEYEIAAKEFAQNFINRFGEPDPNHDWGFGKLNAFVVSNTTSTRAYDTGGAGQVHTERNQWAANNNGVYNDGALAKEVTIPGWPNFDGRYYVSYQGNQSLYNIVNNMPDGDQSRPIGDVTEYEIQYVSHWFRTHKIENPEDFREDLHLSDFFIQNVSADNDQWEYVKDGKDVGNNGEDVVDISKDHCPDNIKIKKTDNTHTVQFDLDHLEFAPIGASSTVDDSWTHVNNFNAQINNWHPEDNPYYNTSRTIMYVTSSGTENFACHPSQATSPEYIYNWVLVRLTWIEDGIQREGYYLAFDYEGNKDEFDVAGDGYYSNWIVKITPAHFSPKGQSKRIMCEDLGNTFDFDFNDVVFDVRYETYWDNKTKSQKTDAIVTLQAAGGTLPIYVGMNPASCNPTYEAHSMLGKAGSTPINVGVGSDLGTAIYRIPNLTSTDPDDIVIYVKYSNGTTKSVAKAYRGNVANNSTSGEEISPDGGYKPGPYDTPTALTETTVPQKIAVSVQTEWMKELEWIERSYEYFPKWANNKEYTTDVPEKPNWYDIQKNTDKLYYRNNSFVPGMGGNPTGSSQWGAEGETDHLTAFPDINFDGAKGGLQIKGYTEGDPICNHLTNGNVSKIIITIVYDSDAPFNGKLVPTDAEGNHFVSDSGTQFTSMIAATKQAKNRRFTHRFVFNTSDVVKTVDGEVSPCDYLVLYLDGNPEIENWYCTYE